MAAMSEQEILERARRAALSIVAPDDRYEDLLRRRDRKRRNQRITAGVVGIAVFVSAIVAVGVAARDSGQQPATSGTTGPSVVPPGPTGSDYVLDLDTGAMTPLPRSIFRSLDQTDIDGHYIRGGRYAASPDGSTLAFVGLGDEGSLQIFIAGIDGSGVRQVTHDPVAAVMPAWSPDGTTIAYKGYASGGDPGLFVLDVATGEATVVIDVSPRPGQGWPTFTPDGSSLLYSGGPEVRTVPVAGGKSTVLFGRGRGGMGNAGEGSMSPDGSLVTMMGNEPDGPGALRFVANANGTDLRVISGGSSTPAGTWSPDGTRIVCSGPDPARIPHIVVVDVATGVATKVAEGGAAIWLDDHTLLVEAFRGHI
jgi:Tol biopolymer transport system component